MFAGYPESLNWGKKENEMRKETMLSHVILSETAKNVWENAVKAIGPFRLRLPLAEVLLESFGFLRVYVATAELGVIVSVIIPPDHWIPRPGAPCIYCGEQILAFSPGGLGRAACDGCGRYWN